MTSFAESLDLPGAPTHPDGSSLAGISRTEILRRIAEKLDDSGIDIDSVAHIERISLWDGPGGQPMVALRFSSSFEAGPEWPVADAAKPVKITRPKAPKTKGDTKTAVFLPDPQVGFLSGPDGSLVPVHDPSAIDVALSILKDVKADEVVWLGDYVDFPEFSTKFVRHPSFSGHAQATIDTGHRILGRALSVTPEGSPTIVMPGNHEKRMSDYLLQNAREAFGLKRAAEPPTSWPVMSVPYLLRLEDLGIDYGEAYPSGQHWLRPDIRVIHGDTVSSQGSTAATIAKKKPVSTIFGHVHRIELHSQQWELGTEWRECVTFTPGCLCATDGAVPSASSAINEDGSFVRQAENWNQGMAVMSYTDEPGSPIGVEFAHISNGTAHFRGNTYRSDVDRFDWEY